MGVLTALVVIAFSAAATPASSAATSAGELYAFGDNSYGQLGIATNSGTLNPNPTPALVSLPGASGPVTEVAAGEDHSLALTSTGQLFAFGDNYYGQLGSATNNGNDNPVAPTQVSLPGASGTVTQITAGEYHSLTVTSSGQLFAFGENHYGELGTATNSGTESPTPPTQVSLPGAGGPVTEVAAGPLHSLALTSTGQLYAFGDNNYGQLGIATNSGTDNPNPTPALVSLPGASGPVTQIAAGGDHSLALTSTGQLYAFGDNYYGQLGIATNNGNDNPVAPTQVSLPGASGPVTQIAAGYYHSLAVTSSRQLFAFGENRYGQVGTATNSGTVSPVPPTQVSLPGTSGPTVRVAAGVYDSLALTSTGQLFTFGLNESGQLGRATNSGTLNPSPTPVQVDLGAGATVDTMAPGPSADHTLALVADLAVTSSSLPGGRVGAPYSAGATSEGGTPPFSWRASGLPAGLSIDPASGRISGMPTSAGTAQVQLGVSDRFGITAQSAPLSLKIEARPVISKLRQSHTRWREGRGLAKVSSLAATRKGRAPLGTTFTFKLNATAKVRFAFTPPKKGRKGKRSAGATLSFTGHPGTNRVVFQGRLTRHKKLGPGPYKLTATANAGGARSKPRSLTFTIVR